jgi:hypothetical protein
VRLALTRTFEVAASRARVWAHLERLQDWPTWAGHIRSVTATPPGPLTPATVGVIRLKNGIRSSFRMTDLRPPDAWTWAGRFLWMPIRYDHVFEERGPERTRVRFDVFAGGLGNQTLGRLFAWIYGKNLDRAIPRLVAQLTAP